MKKAKIIDIKRTAKKRRKAKKQKLSNKALSLINFTNNIDLSKKSLQ